MFYCQSVEPNSRHVKRRSLVGSVVQSVKQISCKIVLSSNILWISPFHMSWCRRRCFVSWMSVIVNVLCHSLYLFERGSTNRKPCPVSQLSSVVDERLVSVNCLSKKKKKKKKKKTVDYTLNNQLDTKLYSVCLGVCLYSEPWTDVQLFSPLKANCFESKKCGNR